MKEVKMENSFGGNKFEKIFNGFLFFENVNFEFCTRKTLKSRKT
jgi:hypothetical protein